MHSDRPSPIALAPTNAMADPYDITPMWPHLGDIKAGGAIGSAPDGKGGTWPQHRALPALLHIDASRNVTKRIDMKLSVAHGLCLDSDGNLWVGDSGPFWDGALPDIKGIAVYGFDASVKGFQVYKFSPEGELLLTLGKPGVSKAGPDTFLGPAAIRETPDGDILIADGHWPRPTTSQQDGDRLVWYSRDGKFLKEFGRHGRGPGEFIGPHGLAFDSQGRLFVADRSNSRIQIFDKDMNVVDEWRHFWPSERHLDPQGRHPHRFRLGIEPLHRRTSRCA
jgi:sugar lactone lactonase YvrE